MPGYLTLEFDSIPHQITKSTTIRVSFLAIPWEDFKGTVRFEFDVDPTPALGDPPNQTYYLEGDGEADAIEFSIDFEATVKGDVYIYAYKNYSLLAEESDYYVI